MKKTVEQAENLKDANCPTSPVEMIEAGKWYKVESVDALFYLEEITEDNKCKGYGFLDGEWHDSREGDIFMGFATEAHDFVEASNKEVEEALIKEAKKRYKIGDKLSKVHYDHSRGKRIFSHDLFTEFKEDNTKLWLSDDAPYSNGYYSCIFYNGTWADVVVPAKEPKIGDICKFWNDDKEFFTIGKLESIDYRCYKYLNINDENYYMSCQPLDPNMTLGEVFGKEGNNE